MTTIIKLYDHQASIHAQYARIVLHLAGIEYKKIHINLPLGNLDPSYAKISASLSIPALEIISTKNGNKTTLTDSRDIINYCTRRTEGLFPKDKMDEINTILDLIYKANGGQISFQSYAPQDRIFDIAVNTIMSSLRQRKLRRLAHNESTNLNIPESPRKKVYKSAVERLDRPIGCIATLDELIQRANETMSVLDEKLSKSKWLLGDEHTAIDSIAAIWVQWIVYNNLESIPVTPRVLDFLKQSKQRSEWKKTKVEWVIPYIKRRVYFGICVMIGLVYLLANRFGSSLLGVIVFILE